MDERTVTDEWEIGRVLARYCRFLDDRQWDGVVSLFAEDCVFETMGRRLEGRPAVRAFFPAESIDASRPQSMHVLSNVVIDVEDDRAVAESDWVMVSRDVDGRTGIGPAPRGRRVADRASGRRRARATRRLREVKLERSSTRAGRAG
jgi:ketosteroid isomerase-like protein